MKVLYARSSQHRKPEYRVITKILEDNGKREVVKLAATPEADGHIKSLPDKYHSLEKYGSKLSICPPAVRGQEVTFPFLSGSTLMQKLEDSVLINDREHSLEIISEFIELVHSLPSKQHDPSSRRGFVKQFGKHFTGVMPCTDFACLDLNLDNLINFRGKNTLIDYEWTFDFPIPVDYLICRSLYYAFAGSLAGFMEALAGSEYPVTEPYPGVLVPSFIIECYPRYFDTQLIRRTCESDRMFQRVVTLRDFSPEFKADFSLKTHTEPIFKGYYEAGLERKHRDEQMRKQVEKLDSELKSIKHSRAWRLFSIYLRLKP